MNKDAIESIAKRAGLRTSAVEDWLKENDIDAEKMARLVTKMNLKQILDLSIAFVGDEKSKKSAIGKIKKELK